MPLGPMGECSAPCSESAARLAGAELRTGDGQLCASADRCDLEACREPFRCGRSSPGACHDDRAQGRKKHLHEPRRVTLFARRFAPGAGLMLPGTRNRHRLLQLPPANPISPHRLGCRWRVDRVTLSRMEIEWLVASVYERAQLMPRDVHERLKSLGFVNDEAKLTCAGRHWLDEWRRQHSG